MGIFTPERALVFGCIFLPKKHLLIRTWGPKGRSKGSQETWGQLLPRGMIKSIYKSHCLFLAPTPRRKNDAVQKVHLRPTNFCVSTEGHLIHLLFGSVCCLRYKYWLTYVAIIRFLYVILIGKYSVGIWQNFFNFGFLWSAGLLLKSLKAMKLPYEKWSLADHKVWMSTSQKWDVFFSSHS